MASRDPQSEKVFKIMEEAAIKQKWTMKYAYIGGPMPSAEVVATLDAARKRQEDVKVQIDTELARLEATKRTAGTWTKERK